MTQQAAIAPAISLLVSLIALIIAWDNARKSHRILIRIKKVGSGGSGNVRENGGRHFAFFFAYIQNAGLSLHDVHVSLVFQMNDAFGTCSIPLWRYDIRTEKRLDGGGQFEKGMVGKFGWKSYELDVSGRAMLADLRHLGRQQVELVVYAQGFQVKRFRVGGMVDRVSGLWNQMARVVNSYFEHQVRNSKGKVALKMPKVIPILPDLAWSVGCFLRSLAELTGSEAGATSAGV